MTDSELIALYEARLERMREERKTSPHSNTETAPHENTAGAGEGEPIWISHIRNELEARVSPSITLSTAEVRDLLTKLDEAQKEAEWSFHGCVQAKAELFDERSKSHDLQSQLQAAKGREEEFLKSIEDWKGLAEFQGPVVCAVRKEKEDLEAKIEELESEVAQLQAAKEEAQQWKDAHDQAEAQNATLSKKVEELEEELSELRSKSGKWGIV